MEIWVETLPAMRVACCRALGRAPDREARRMLATWLDQRQLAGPVRWFGFEVEVAPEQCKAGLRSYEAWIPIPAGVQLPQGMGIKEFPGGLYAVAAVSPPDQDDFAAIQRGWKRLHSWVIESDCCRSANHQWLEEFIPRPNGFTWKLYHPIVDFSGSAKIRI